ncbi:hypothetical protein OB236_18275 [Paenibacillus sp. WQ 127069]|uniref:Uncharacterized protein n=1 Tax=Paenibacillus baimaensis TaxID=2982185 RepID=A0ABT2UJJ9_9BACL|nr:hypothetical protein [Paenibacillus sp. WQ 127069]MCU6794052.1 hypothetical protein [Paenibacillus sp. WQ 127069]
MNKDMDYQAYDMGDVETHKLKTKLKLASGDIFKAKGQAEGQKEIYWQVVRQVEKNTYMCKVVGINEYTP